MANLSESLTVRLLIVSQDIGAIELLCHLIQRMAMHVEICPDIATALRKICHSKFEGIVVDLTQEKEALQFISQLHDSTSHRQAITFAILNNSGRLRSPAAAGVHFVLQHPLATTEVYRTLKAAYPLMVRERRRCFRCPVSMPVVVGGRSSPEFAAVSLNISEGGMALETGSLLRVGEVLRLCFQLPGNTRATNLTAEVCWTKSGRAGVQFCRVSRETLEQLQSWLSQRLQESLPEVDCVRQME